MKKLVVILLLMVAMMSYSKDLENQHVPIVYYINEAGVMVGDFYYNTNVFNNKTKFTGVALYSPTTDIFTVMGTMWDYPLTEKLSFGSKLRYIKFNDIHNGWPGNDSSDKEYEIVFDSNLERYVPTKGYDLYKGNTQYYELNMAYKLSVKDTLNAAYRYEGVKSQRRTYKSDTVSLLWERKETDSKNNPRKGYKIRTGVKKNLNKLGHDSENNWDYFKLSFDFRKYIPVFKNSTLALRFYTESTGGKEVVDEDRTNALKLRGEDGEISYYAPFFDNALLGDLQNFKGYYYYRFYDKHMALWQAELRFPITKRLKGLQGNIFAELGRVGSSYDTDMFTKDLKSCFGFGFRYHFNDDIVIRGDAGASSESIQMRINEGQVF